MGSSDMPDAEQKTVKKRSLILILAVAFIFVALIAAVVILVSKLNEKPAAAQTPCLDTGKCLVGVSYSDTVPGFRVKNGKEYFGFDVDIANYLTSKLNRGAPVFVQADRDQSLTDPDQPVHMYISTVSMTDDRLEKMTFVGPYMRTFQGIIVNNESEIEDEGGLDRKSICVAEDTTSEVALKAYARTHSIDVRSESTAEQCNEAMKNGTYDAVTGDYVTLQTYAHADPSLRPIPSIKIADSYELYGIALPRESMALCQKLKPLVKDFIREKWEPAFNSNLQPLDITYDPNNTTIPSLKPGENLVDIHSCR